MENSGSVKHIFGSWLCKNVNGQRRNLRTPALEYFDTSVSALTRETGEPV